VRLEALARPCVHEQRLEHVLDPLRGTEDALHAGAAATAGNNCEIARPRVTRAFSVDYDRHAWREVRLPDQQLAPTGKLDHDWF
jgi:hypothetical protein